MEIQTKRVYEPAVPEDGFRVLVDRLWPRGLNKDQVNADLWMKEVAPSTELRKWFNHDPAKADEFKRRYARELDAQPGSVERLLAEAKKGRLTLLFASRNEQFNQVVALREYLLAKQHE